MDDDYSKPGYVDDVKFINYPPPIWSILLIGDPKVPLSCVYFYSSHNVRWFHRKMTEIFFGFKWERVQKDTK